MAETGSAVDEVERAEEGADPGPRSRVPTAPTSVDPPGPTSTSPSAPTDPDPGATEPSPEPREGATPVVTLADGALSFGDFYSGHYAQLVRLAALLSGSRDTAPDLVQDCFVRLHGRWSSVRDPLPYIRRSVVHACASHHRRAAVVRRNPLPEPPAAELGADELEDALAALPARQRAAVVLRYYGDLPDADIARALRCREGTVRSLVSRALADLRKVIEP